MSKIIPCMSDKAGFGLRSFLLKDIQQKLAEKIRVRKEQDREEEVKCIEKLQN